jgi:hypothetical protein
VLEGHDPVREKGGDPLTRAAIPSATMRGDLAAFSDLALTGYVHTWFAQLFEQHWLLESQA